jgi:hypothetical protein
MTAVQSVSDLFEPQPIQWGFRGDPYLWAEMSTALAGVAVPSSAEQFTRLLEDTFAELVGAPLNSPQSSVFVERYSHGGMSSGRVSLAFWRDRGFPLLQARYVGA